MRRLWIASAPCDLPRLLFVARLDSSAFSRSLVAAEAVTELDLDPPSGAFALDSNSERPAIFLADERGIVPVRSIFRDATARQLGRRLVLFYASQAIAEAAFLSDLERCAHVNPHVGLTFAIAGDVPRSIVAAACTVREFLNPEVLRPWPYDAGTINADLLHAHLHDTERGVFHLAGAANFVRHMREVLTELGADSDRIVNEEVIEN